MKTSLDLYLTDYLQKNGPISVKDFIAFCLYHPKYGYYMNQVVFGTKGDFTTAPEISQLFGEMTGIWFMHYLHNLKTIPSSLSLIELGPGRGTLMEDMIKVFKRFPVYFNNLKIYLIEISPFLRQQQKQKLVNAPIEWVNTFDQIPESEATLVIANEFFDALPIDQSIQINNQWQKRHVGFVDNKIDFLGPQEASIREEHQSYKPVIDSINQRFKHKKGAALIIDYGEELDNSSLQKHKTGTLQALYRHKYASLFENIGHQDISHGVNFNALKQYLDPSLKTTLTAQGVFLLSQGLEHRLQSLCQKASLEETIELKTAALRLISPQEMGTLFKVLTIESPE